MRRVVSIFICLFFILIYSSVISFSQTDLSGRWEGTTEVPDMGEDELVLVLKKDNGSYTGTISDSMGMLMETEIEDVEIEDNTLTFNFTVFTGEDYMKVYVTLNVEGEKMSGYWETEDGSSGSIELEKVE